MYRKYLYVLLDMYEIFKKANNAYMSFSNSNDIQSMIVIKITTSHKLVTNSIYVMWLISIIYRRAVILRLLQRQYVQYDCMHRDQQDLQNRSSSNHF